MTQKSLDFKTMQVCSIIFLVLLGSCSSRRVFSKNSRYASMTSIDSNAPQEWNFNSGSEHVWYGNDLIYENYLGKKSLEYDANFTRTTKFRICSNSKLMTTVAFLQLVEQGRISSIFDPINLYLDENDLQAWGYPAGSTTFCPTVFNSSSECQNITFVSLMSMSSGIIAAIACDYPAGSWQTAHCIPQSNQTVYPGSIATTISYFIQNPLNWPPGPAYNSSYNTYHYANENFIVLSYFVEKYANMSLETYLQTHVYQPLGMNHTLYDPWGQAFSLQSDLASEYYFYTNYYNESVESALPFAFGSCASTEVSPGFQAGSGGVISTLPDMAKWFSSLFITQNSSLISSASLDMILYPWSLAGSDPYQYYGLGIEMIYNDPILSLPVYPTPVPRPDYTYYMGGSLCMFFSVVIVNSTTNYFTGEPLITLPMLSLVARNNRILNITQEIFSSIPERSSGTWYDITDWPYGWGASNAELTDTTTEALNLAQYFASYPYTPTGSAPTAVPVPSPSSGSKQGLSDVGVVLVATLVPCLVVLVCTVMYFLIYWTPKSVGQSKGKDRGEVNENPMPGMERI